MSFSLILSSLVFKSSIFTPSISTAVVFIALLRKFDVVIFLAVDGADTNNTDNIAVIFDFFSIFSLSFFSIIYLFFYLIITF